MSADTGAIRQDDDLDWEDRRRTTLEAARRRSMVIRILRLSFLILAAAIIAVVAGYIIVHALRKEPPPAPQPIVEGEEVRMINPRFSGRDRAGRPYVVIADSATRREDDPEVTDLVNPRLDTAPDAGSSHVSASRGVYDANRKILDLYDDVRLETPDGNLYHTTHTRLFIDSDFIEGDQPVSGAGPLGTIRADRFQVINGGERVVFTGHVITHIKNSAAANGDSHD